MEEMLMKKSQADEDENYTFLMSLHITYNKQTAKKKSLYSYKSGQTCWINLYAPCILCIGQAYCYSPECAFYIFSQQIYYLIIF